MRVIVAIAGPPAAGKSTFAHRLAKKLPNSKVLEMDGFHYDNAVLDELGLRHCKGAPETFDFHGFATTLKRIRANESNVAVPVFDRSIDLARAGADLIQQEIKFIITEGNYLLLDEPPWNSLAEFFDFTIFLDVSIDELEARLYNRWKTHGKTREQAAHWIETNDLPNIRRVLSARRKADYVINFQSPK